MPSCPSIRSRQPRPSSISRVATRSRSALLAGRSTRWWATASRRAPCAACSRTSRGCSRANWLQAEWPSPGGDMKVNPQIITLLNDVLTAELTAINQYFLHARLCHHWGYERLYEKVRKESIGEMKHADALIDRILFLDGLPNLQKLGKANVGHTVPEQFELHLQLDYEAVKRLNDGIEACRSLADSGTRELLEHMLREE